MRDRLKLPHHISETVLLAVTNVVSFSDTFYGRAVLALVGWLIVGFVPLVSFEAGGGQTSVDVIRYVVFRGVDRDIWYAVSPWGTLGGLLFAASLLAGMVCTSIGLLFRDVTYLWLGWCMVGVSLLGVIICAGPIASLQVLGLAVPHVGWWLLLLYLGLGVVTSLAEGHR